MKSEEQFPFLNLDSLIPDEIIWKIFDNLDTEDLKKIAAVNWRGYNLVKNYQRKIISKEVAGLGYHLTSNIPENELLQIFERNTHLSTLSNLISIFKQNFRKHIPFPTMRLLIKKYYELLQIKVFKDVVKENMVTLENTDLNANPILLLNLIYLNEHYFTATLTISNLNAAENLWHAYLTFINTNCQSITALAYFYKYFQATSTTEYQEFANLLNEKITPEKRTNCLSLWLINLNDENLKQKIQNMSSEELLNFEKFLTLLLPREYEDTCRKIQLLIRKYTLDNFLKIISLEESQVIELFDILPLNENILQQLTAEEIINLPVNFANISKIFYEEYEEFAIKDIWELLPQFSAKELYNFLNETDPVKEIILQIILEKKIAFNFLETNELTKIINLLYQYENNEKIKEEIISATGRNLFHIILQLALSHGINHAQKLVDDLNQAKDMSMIWEIIDLLGELNNVHLKIILNHYSTLHEWLELHQVELPNQPSSWEEDEDVLQTGMDKSRVIHSPLKMLTLNFELTKYFLSQYNEEEKSLSQLICDSALTKKILTSKNHFYLFWQKIFSVINPYKIEQLQTTSMSLLIALFKKENKAAHEYCAYIINTYSSTIALRLMTTLLETLKGATYLINNLENLLFFYQKKTIFILLNKNFSVSKATGKTSVNLLLFLLRINPQEESLWELTTKCLNNIIFHDNFDEINFKIIFLAAQYSSNMSDLYKKENLIDFYQNSNFQTLQNMFKESLPLKTEKQTIPLNFNKFFELPRNLFMEWKEKCSNNNIFDMNLFKDYLQDKTYFYLYLLSAKLIPKIFSNVSLTNLENFYTNNEKIFPKIIQIISQYQHIAVGVYIMEPLAEKISDSQEFLRRINDPLLYLLATTPNLDQFINCTILYVTSQDNFSLLEKIEIIRVLDEFEQKHDLNFGKFFKLHLKNLKLLNKIFEYIIQDNKINLDSLKKLATSQLLKTLSNLRDKEKIDFINTHFSINDLVELTNIYPLENTTLLHNEFETCNLLQLMCNFIEDWTDFGYIDRQSIFKILTNPKKLQEFSEALAVKQNSPSETVLSSPLTVIEQQVMSNKSRWVSNTLWRQSNSPNNNSLNTNNNSLTTSTSKKSPLEEIENMEQSFKRIKSFKLTLEESERLEKLAEKFKEFIANKQKTSNAEDQENIQNEKISGPTKS